MTIDKVAKYKVAKYKVVNGNCTKSEDELMGYT